MPKLLQINVTVNQGSTGRIAEQIGDAAMASGWDSYIAYGRGAGKSSSKTIKIGSKIGAYLHALLTRITDRHGLYSRFATRKLIRKISAINPDIIHLHNIHGYYINYRILFEYLQNTDIPVVWTLHDCWPMTGHCAHFIDVGCLKWKTGCYSCPLSYNYPCAIVDNSYRNYHIKRRLFTSLSNRLNLVSVSKWLAGVVAESFFAHGNASMHMLYNGVDTSIFYPQEFITKSELGLPDKKILLAVATSWERRKGLDDLCKLSAMLSDRYQLVLIGLRPEQIGFLPSNIIGLSRTEDVKKLAQYYSVADAVLNLSYAETFGLTTVEGLSCGTPSIVYNATASPELVQDDRIGRIVEPGDIFGVLSAIESLCAEDREILRNRCREYAVAHFDKQECFKKYIDLYAEIIQKR